MVDKKILLFMCFCIPLRFILAMTPSLLDEKYLPYLGLLLLAISMGFLYLFFFNGRMNAPEAGGNTWWHDYRLIHGLLYLCASIYAFKKNNKASIPLLIDVMFGMVLFYLVEIHKN
ncbi:hypothetical protein EBX93_18395 [bacterium]|nr:hypothetical protein [bacterium]